MKHKHVSMRSKKAAAVLASVLVLLVAVAGGTLAYLIAGTDPVVNRFTYSSIPIVPEETIEKDVKKNVRLSAKGADAETFVRADVVITWKDEAGNVAAQVPQMGTDYTITYGSGWTQLPDGHWYYTQELAAGAETTPLIVECKKTDTPSQPDGYDLSVEILAQAVQAEPAQAMADLWGMQFANGVFTPVP